MLKRLPQSAFLFAFLGTYSLFAQTPTPSSLDDTLQLNEVVVRGYATNRRLLETAASVGLLTRRDLNQRFGTPTLVPALNTLPGVRADERSPGSYRLAIRGSAIRSPFGVRNVKAYWNELPLTDAGGNTPLNALDVRALGRIEVIKGPSGSLYGAGTGGTILFSGLAVPQGQSNVEVSALGGSYGLLGNGVVVQTGKNNSAITLNYNHLQSDGYRNHSALVRDNISLIGSFNVSDKRTVSVLGLYSDLHYQTPGGLTQAQFQVNPRASRLATRTLPSSAEQRAGIYQKVGYLGLSHEYRWNDRIQNTTVLYGSTTDFANPFITNYEKRTDQGMGGRTVTQIRLPNGPLPTTFTVGAELLRNFTIVRNFGNRLGTADTIQTDEELIARQSTVFAQAEMQLPARFRLTAGLSRNDVRYGFTRFPTRAIGALPATLLTRNFSPVWLPRLALLRTFGPNVSGFVSISTGYSAPSSQEVRPSAGGFSTTLNPERGTSYEAGLRGSAIQSRLRYDVAVYQFALRQTIVRRSNEAGAEYFINAGRTDQRGLEAQFSYDFVRPTFLSATERGFLSLLRIWHSLTLTDYRFRDYIQGTSDLSNNRVPGVAPATLVTGLDAETRPGLYAHLTYQFLNPFPLNDANTVSALPTRLLQATLGFRRPFGQHWTLDVYASGDNLLNQTYSLGYDLNAVGNRYYNASPTRNGIGGIRISAKW
ncbi:TonB-dependent receptor plug domain-containing protein [Spirosoma taeanense]|uniref:TonB-dependent receptor plug domain-containing protein n=1 Tax=Spirosoma taeanense TaxID=2735870 RepID=A0A6M5YAS0_9BACT|nr:TonB-dependent receptor [Spirosoma taeanense]QJW90390.1 TonB-dependent receptor plug domain-containing protein [Spirosoma taeanense]